MNELKTGFGRKSADGLRTFGGSVHHALSTGDGLTYFATVDPTPADVLTATTNYGDALDLADSKNATQARASTRKELIHVLQRVAADCELIADGNRMMLVASGFELRKAPEHSHLPPAKPGNLRLKAGPLSGGIVAKVAPVTHADSYEMQTTADPVNGPWSASTPHTNSQNMAKTGLTPLTRIYVRVHAIGANGPGEWSDVAQVAVL